MKPTHQPSMMHFKSAQIAGVEVSPNDMAQINKYALQPLSQDDIFAFKVSMAANEVDRDYEVFPRTTLSRLASLFVGKTVVKDHDHKSDNQIARIYATDLVESNHMHLTKNGEIFTELVAKCYMVKTATNADLISEIRAGIRKEVSLGCSIGKAICSICDTDNVKTYCTHFGGRQYEGQTCYFSLEQPKDAYELSFVAIPAQQHAGTVKSYGEKPCYKADMDTGAKAETGADENSHTRKEDSPEQRSAGDQENRKHEEPNGQEEDRLTVNQAESTLTAKLAFEIAFLSAKMSEILSLLRKDVADSQQNAPETPENAPKSDENAPHDAECAPNTQVNAPDEEEQESVSDNLRANNPEHQSEDGRLTVNQESVDEHSEDQPASCQGENVGEPTDERVQDPELEPENENLHTRETPDSGEERLTVNQEGPSEQTFASSEEPDASRREDEALEETEEEHVLKTRQAEARLRALDLTISLRKHTK